MTSQLDRAPIEVRHNRPHRMRCAHRGRRLIVLPNSPDDRTLVHFVHRNRLASACVTVFPFRRIALLIKLYPTLLVVEFQRVQRQVFQVLESVGYQQFPILRVQRHYLNHLPELLLMPVLDKLVEKHRLLTEFLVKGLNAIWQS